MKCKTLTMFSLVLCLFSTLSFGLLCPNSFKYIQEGDSLNQVLATCGQPSSKTEQKIEVDNTPQEWSYFTAPTPDQYHTQNNASSIRMQIMFDETGKAINISVNGVSLTSSNLCGGTIRAGDTRDKISSICGKPKLVNKSNDAPSTNDPLANDDKKNTQVTLIYGGQGQSATSLVFKDGHLVGTK